MWTIAKIELDFDPNQRTGSYIGLFQLDRDEFATYGSGDITNPRDKAIAATYKFASEAKLFETDAHKKPTLSDLYLIYQQGWRGAAEHVSQPDRIAWKSMCATNEGRQRKVVQTSDLAEYTSSNCTRTAGKATLRLITPATEN